MDTEDYPLDPLEEPKFATYEQVKELWKRITELESRLSILEKKFKNLGENAFDLRYMS